MIRALRFSGLLLLHTLIAIIGSAIAEGAIWKIVPAHSVAVCVVEGMRFQHYLCNSDWVRHVESIADSGCKVGVGSSLSVVRIWVPDKARRRFGRPLRPTLCSRSARHEELLRVYRSSISCLFLFGRCVHFVAFVLGTSYAQSNEIVSSDDWRNIASLTMSAVSSNFRAYLSVHSEKSAISLLLKWPYQPQARS